MNMRWLVFDYVGPELRLPRSVRRKVRRRAMALNHFRRRTTAITFLVLLPTLTMYVWGVVHYSGRFVNAVVAEGGLLLRILIIYLSIWLVFAWLGRWLYRPLVLRALRDLGHDVCLKCGYALRGLACSVERCPECGELRPPESCEPRESPPKA